MFPSRASEASAAEHRVLLACLMRQAKAGRLTRKEFLTAAGLVGCVVPFAGLLPAPAGAAAVPAPVGRAPGEPVRVVLSVNGRERTLVVDPRVTLLDALRESLSLPGTKKGCDHGQCGACTVLVDGRRVLSCLTLAAMAAGHRVTTIEGLAEGDRLHPMQAAFLEHDGFQCGYCTSGQIMSAVGLLGEGTPADAEAIREAMSGNLCRCGAYPNIVDAILQVRRATPS